MCVTYAYKGQGKGPDGEAASGGAPSPPVRPHPTQQHTHHSTPGAARHDTEGGEGSRGGRGER